jgi:hypothetical protein
MFLKALLVATGVFVILIALVLLVDPESYFRLYATAYDPAMVFPARRFAPAVLALGVVLIAARSLKDGPFLRTLCVLTALAFLGVAGTGLQAWVSGTARAAILGAAAVEVVIAALFLLAAKQVQSR